MVAELESMVDKLEVMVRKRDLGKGIYVDEDLEKEEREVQKRLRWLAYKERLKGKRVDVGNGGMWIEERWYRWDEEEED